MKGINIFHLSQSAAAICLTTMEQPQSSSPSSSASVLPGSSPAIDRYNPIIRDSSRIAKIPITPNKLQKSHHHSGNKHKKFPSKDQSKKSEISTLDDEKVAFESILDINTNDGDSSAAKKSWKCAKPGDFSSPPGSTRHLLEEEAFSDVVSDFKSASTLFVEETSIDKDVKTEELCDPPDQVVVLRVSLHCRGCERKMRKHLSKMEGVTSFNIDFAAKKVTVSGNVTPLEVLSSISKVKNAQLWSPTITSSINFRNNEFYVGEGGVSVL